MADTPTSSAPIVWASTTADIDALHQQLGSETANRRALEDQLAASEEDLLGLQAPDVSGVIRKLEVLWEQQLHGMDQASGWKLQILDDLRRHTTA
ncbi:MAG: hypothetical protein E2586_20840 [Novosphingobium sp.]|uniref:hypothetical protein n=1 Tax=Novosphingobium sp. TaxID=1874826 RepID=UPI0012BFCB4A|nr:hypothetical protein [Novosphingobium sp.]MPS70929.1 hypothetical protein [Novosphingobium sp.]